MISIVHTRDPDGACDLRVFIDGVESQDWYYADIDPGRGWTAADFAEQWAYERARVEGEAREVIDASFAGSAESPYVEGQIGLCNHCGEPAYDDNGRWRHGDIEHDDTHTAEVTS